MVTALDFFKTYRTFLGLELRFEATGEITLHEFQVKVVGEKLQFLQKRSDLKYQNLSEVIQELPKDMPINLSLAGKGIITKYSKAKDPQKAIKQSVPGYSEDLFYAQVFTLKKDEHILSIAKQEKLQEILLEFKKAKLWVVSLHLGAQSSLTYAPLFGVEKLDIERFEIDFVQQTIHEVAPNDANDLYNIKGEEILQNELTAFFSVYPPLFGGQDNAPVQVLENQKEFSYKRYLEIYGVTIIAIFFLLLLSNFFLFSHYNGKNNTIAGVSSSYNAKKTILDSLRTQYESKKVFMDHNSYQGKHFAFYSDRIAAHLPQNIRLQHLSFNPLEKKIKKREAIEISKNTLFIQASSLQVNPFDAWIDSLATKEWFKNVQLKRLYEKKGEYIIELELELYAN